MKINKINFMLATSLLALASSVSYADGNVVKISKQSDDTKAGIGVIQRNGQTIQLDMASVLKNNDVLTISQGEITVRNKNGCEQTLKAVQSYKFHDDVTCVGTAGTAAAGTAAAAGAVAAGVSTTVVVASVVGLSAAAKIISDNDSSSSSPD